jgi:hypothetical protein
MKRQLSSQIATIQQEVENHHLNNSKKMGPKDVSDYMVESTKADAAKNKEYFDMLNDVDARQKFFNALTTENHSDHSAIKTVKSKISSMIEQEMAELGFKNQLSQEEQ